MISPDGRLSVWEERPSEPARLAFCEWLRRHGIEPNEVPLYGWVRRCPETFQVRYVAYVRNEKGRLYPNESGTDAVKEIRTVQLEGPPLPFPES